MSYACEIPGYVPSMIENIPEEALPGDMSMLWRAIAIELGELLRYGSQAAKPQIILTSFQKSGTQYIAEFSVSDLEIPKRQTNNFHGQNTSQWLYAGAIVIQDGRVSRHH